MVSMTCHCRRYSPALTRRSLSGYGEGCSRLRPTRCHSRFHRRAAALRIAAQLTRVHWVRPELVAEVKYLAWTGDNLLRQVVYEGLREDKPAAEVSREMPRAK